MTYLQKTLTHRVACDKPYCSRALKVPDETWATYEDRFTSWYAQTGWSMWVGRSQRHYCTDHRPSAPSTMRQVV